jgi:hypothetical protein
MSCRAAVKHGTQFFFKNRSEAVLGKNLPKKPFPAPRGLT